jgi:hypothetical protein
VLERELDLVRLGSGKKKNDASPRLDPPTCSSSNPAGPHARARAAQLPFLVAVPKLFFFLSTRRENITVAAVLWPRSRYPAADQRQLVQETEMEISKKEKKQKWTRPEI